MTVLVDCHCVVNMGLRNFSYGFHFCTKIHTTPQEKNDSSEPASHKISLLVAFKMRTKQTILFFF